MRGALPLGGGLSGDKLGPRCTNGASPSELPLDAVCRHEPLTDLEVKNHNPPYEGSKLRGERGERAPTTTSPRLSERTRRWYRDNQLTVVAAARSIWA